MVICKYFLQGTCRFGNNCKFDHQVGGPPSNGNYGNNNSVLLNNYQTKPQVAPSSVVDTDVLVKAVVNDMTSAEKGGQWLLSSYAPFQDKPIFPGFEDHSMEEIRFLFYEAMKNGNVEQYKQNLQMMLQQTMARVKALQNLSPEAVNMLKTIYNTPIRNGGQFGPQKSIFGATAPNTFANNSAVFQGAQTQSSIFGGQAQSRTVTNNSIFGAQPQSSSVRDGMFGGQAQQTSSANNSSGSIFGASSQPSQMVGGIFGGQTQPQPASTWQAQPQPAPILFGGQVEPPSTNSNIFATSPASDSIFGRPSSNIFPNQHSANIFGVTPQIQDQPQPNEDFYSKLEDLSEEEIKWYQIDDLDLSKIPEKPPTFELCFKVQ